MRSAECGMAADTGGYGTRESKGKERGSPLPYLSPLCSVPFRVSHYSAITSCLLPPTSSLCMVLPETIHTAVFPPLPACFRSMEAGTARPVCFRSMPAGAPRRRPLTKERMFAIMISGRTFVLNDSRKTPSRRREGEQHSVVLRSSDSHVPCSA